MCRIFWDTILLISGSLFTFGAGQGNSIIDTGYAITATSSITTSSTSAAAPYTSSSTATTTTTTITSTTITTISTTRKIPPVKKFVVAAVRSHFDDCPDSHSHFCFHGTCRFLIQEETPACVCHQGFVGMRCEHADLLAVVANNHRPHTLATALVLCVIGCVLMMLFCTLLHCLWRQDCHRRRHVLHYVPDKSSSMEKGRASYCTSESVV